MASLLLLGVLGVSACKSDAKPNAEAEAAAKKPAASAKTVKAKTKASSKAPSAKEHAAPAEPARYIVPFAWEASNDEPLAQARAFLRETLTDNRIYMEHGPRFFAAFADGQKPRATVVTCSDSRVHTTAFDTTPENDDFMIRNIGNQIANSEGSVDYGVEHLQTPVLLVIGHTGCGAVKAALGDISGQAEPVRRELEKLSVPKPKQGVSPEVAWRDAVVANVHNQVDFALQHFGGRVREGKLTVVGAVYDFRDDMGAGAGKLSIVDVNGNREPERMRAFLDAVESEGASDSRRNAKDGKDAKDPKDTSKVRSHGRDVDALKEARRPLGPADEAMIEALGQIPGLLVQKPEPAAAQAQAQAQAKAEPAAHAAHGAHGH